MGQFSLCVTGYDLPALLSIMEKQNKTTPNYV